MARIWGDGKIIGSFRLLLHGVFSFFFARNFTLPLKTELRFRKSYQFLGFQGPKVRIWSPEKRSRLPIWGDGSLFLPETLLFLFSKNQGNYVAKNFLFFWSPEKRSRTTLLGRPVALKPQSDYGFRATKILHFNFTISFQWQSKVQALNPFSLIPCVANIHSKISRHSISQKQFNKFHIAVSYPHCTINSPIIIREAKT